MQEFWVSGDFLAQRLDVDQRTIQRWAKDGKFRRRNRDEFDLVSADHWVISDLREKLEKEKNSADSFKGRDALVSAQTRKFEAEAKLKELEYDQKTGQLIEVEEAIAEIKDAFARIKSKLTALPARLALELSGMNDPKNISGLLESVIDESLQELSAEFLGEDGG